MKRSKVNKINTTADRSKPVIISANDDSVKEYICNCNFIVHTRKTEGEINCPYCGDIIEIQKTRKRSKLETPRSARNETLVSSIPSPHEKDVRIQHEPEVQGAFKALRDKGIRITSYDVRDGAGRPIHERED